MTASAQGSGSAIDGSQLPAGNWSGQAPSTILHIVPKLRRRDKESEELDRSAEVFDPEQFLNDLALGCSGPDCLGCPDCCLDEDPHRLSLRGRYIR